MSATIEEVMRVLGNATKPMTSSGITNAGDFDSPHLVAVALHDLSQNLKNPKVIRVTPEAGGKFQYRLAGRDDVRPEALAVIPRTPAPRIDPARPVEAAKPKLAPAPTPANDGAYAAVLFDLRKKRDGHAAEIVKIDAAIESVEALG